VERRAYALNTQGGGYSTNGPGGKSSNASIEEAGISHVKGWNLTPG